MFAVTSSNDADTESVEEYTKILVINVLYMYMLPLELEVAQICSVFRWKFIVFVKYYTKKRSQASVYVCIGCYMLLTHVYVGND